VVYNSYGEWLASPYSKVKSGKAKTCQQCHMVSPTSWEGRKLRNIAPGKGGIDRFPSAIHSHLMTVDETLLQNALTVSASAVKQEGQVLVSDNRLAAFASDTTSFSFVPPETGDVRVTVTVLYRRAFMQLMEWKKWDVPDIVMAEEQLVVGGE